MYVVWVEFLIREEHQVQFLDLVKENARLSLDEVHCHQFDVCMDPDNNRRIVLYEIYTDRAAFQFHLETAHFKTFNQNVTDWVQSKSISIFEREAL